MATKKKAAVLTEEDKRLLNDGKLDVREAIRQVISGVTIVETMKTMIREDKKLTDLKTLDGLKDVCRKFGIDRNKWTNQPQEAVISAIQEHFHNEILQGNLVSEVYREIFNKTRPVYTFAEFILGDDAIPRKTSKATAAVPFTVETLGTGEYVSGQDHDPEFVDECIMEISDFLARMSGDMLFIPNANPDFRLDFFESEKIYLQIDYKDPMELIS